MSVASPVSVKVIDVKVGSVVELKSRVMVCGGGKGLGVEVSVCVTVTV